MKTKVGSNLERVLCEGHFAVTAEIGPPRGPDPQAVSKKAKQVKGIADAYNVTDNQTAVVRMSSIAASRILLDEGLEPVMQMVCRDRNRIAIQSDLLGGWALGMRNCLCLSGDHQIAGGGGKLNGHPGAKTSTMSILSSSSLSCAACGTTPFRKGATRSIRRPLSS